ncbi:hypothetical protein FPOAC1_007261 [Fusarium poae]|uniref:hypothetical protein n=1 Tax=Fusarium poae TaxID=36050 RepID=UPI001CE8E32F|nr:hypothetical protein FPOAC1_007261 [Fusarium poae]KAG8673942.1 hypothetical protein FPOAC1_007261 [Fusarium poae]
MLLLTHSNVSLSPTLGIGSQHRYAFSNGRSQVCLKLFNSFSASKDAPLTSCEESIRDVQCSITQAELEVPPSSRKRPTKRPREEDTTLTLDGITATHRQKGNVQQGGIIDTGNKLQDETTAASIVKRLIDGIKAVQKEVNVHGYKKSYDTSQTVSDELLTGTDSINQLGMNLWNHSDKVEQMAVDVVYLDRLLSSYCRLFLITRQEPVDYDPDPMVNGLYEFRHSLALVLYSAVCREEIQDHNTQQVESRQGDFGTNSAAEGQKPSTSHARSDDATGYGLPQDFRQCETTTLFQPRDNLACNGILLQEFTPPSSREDTDQNNAMADAMAVGTSIDSNPYYPTDLDEVLCNSNMIDYDTDFLGFQ